MEVSSWQWGALALSFLILVGGLVRANRFNEPRYTTHVRKVAAAAAIPILLLLLIPRPHVFDFSVLDAVGDESSNASQDVGETVTRQAREIRTLQSEVKRLRTQVVEMNDYYGQISSTLLILATVGCVTYILSRRREDLEAVDDAPLGLNNDDKK